MKTLCGKNRTVEEQIRTCNVIEILLVICIVLLAGVSIYDTIQGVGIDAGRNSIMCADICILCLNLSNKKKAKKQLEEENKAVGEN